MYHATRRSVQKRCSHAMEISRRALRKARCVSEFCVFLARTLTSALTFMDNPERAINFFVDLPVVVGNLFRRRSPQSAPLSTPKETLNASAAARPRKPTAPWRAAPAMPCALNRIIANNQSEASSPLGHSLGCLVRFSCQSFYSSIAHVRGFTVDLAASPARSCEALQLQNTQ